MYAHCREGDTTQSQEQHHLGKWKPQGAPTVPPVEGLASEALVALLAELLALPKRSVAIVRGATNRQKVVEIIGMTVEDVEKRLGK